MTFPDGFIGSAIAVESFRDMKVLLHGPVGCRRDIAFISSILCPKEPKAPPSAYRRAYYANNHRVPCTEVDGEDYISGAIARLDDALDVVVGTDDDLLAIINTPGVSLIGDNCQDLIIHKGLQDKVIALDADYISIPVGEGYDRTLVKLMKWFSPVKKETRKGTVNILGISLFTRDWKAVLDDLKTLLEALGLEVICTPGAYCSVEEFKDSVNAEFNVVVCSEYCKGLQSLYSEYGVESVDLHEAPIGLDALRRWVSAVAEKCGVNPSPAMGIIDEIAERAYGGLRSSRGSTSLKGRTLALTGDSTIVYPLVRWTYEYLGLVPVSVTVCEGWDDTAMGNLKGFLESIGCSDVLGAKIPDGTYVVAGDGDTVTRMEIGKVCSVGLDIGYPSLYESNFVKKNVIGHNGVLYILERIVNGRPMMIIG